MLMVLLSTPHASCICLQLNTILTVMHHKSSRWELKARKTVFSVGASHGSSTIANQFADDHDEL